MLRYGRRLLFGSALLILVLLGFGVAGKAGDPKLPTPTSKGNDGMIWYDVCDLGIEGKGWEDTESPFDRLPAKAKGVVRDSLWEHSHHSAGLCVRFVTKSAFRVRWTLRFAELAMPHMPSTGVSGVDVYVRTDKGGWRFVRNGEPKYPTTEIRVAGQKKQREYLLYLPLYNGVKSVEIGVPNGGRIDKAPAHPRRPKPVVFYGTSITQGGCVSRPGMAHPAIVGRRLNVPVINLGFSANAKMEPEVATLLAELDPAVYVLDPLWNMSAGEITQRLKPFVRTLRKARPTTPIVLVEDCNVHNEYPTAKSRLLRAAYRELKADGVRHLHYLRGRNMLGRDGEGTVDGVHTTDLGQMRQADAFCIALKRFVH